MKDHYLTTYLTLDEYYAFLNLIGMHPELNQIETKTLLGSSLYSYSLTNPPLELAHKHHFLPFKKKEENIAITIEDPYVTSLTNHYKDKLSVDVLALIKGFFALPSKEEEQLLLETPIKSKK